VLLSSHPPDVASLDLSLLLFEHFFHLSPLFKTELENLKCVLYQVFLHYEVDLRVSPKAGHVVDFEHPRLQLVVEHHIETQEVEAAVWLFGLTCSIQMRKLRLNGKEGFHYHFFDFAPNDSRILSVGSSVDTGIHQLSFEHILESKFVLAFVEILVFFVERVVGEVDVMVLDAFGPVVLLTRQSDQSVIVQKQLHRTNGGGHEHVDPEIVLVAFVEGWPSHVLLHYILHLVFFDLSGLHYLFSLFGVGCSLLSSFNALFDLQVVVHVFTVVFLVFVQLQPQIFDPAHYEDSATLAAGLGLADEENGWVLLRLLLCHFTVFDRFVSLFVFLCAVLLYVVELCWVHPSLRKEVELVRKFLLKPLEMHGQGALATDVVHP